MTSYGLRCLLVSAALLMGGERARSSESTSATPARFVISGTVVNERTGAPIPFAQVQVFRVQPGADEVVTPRPFARGMGAVGGFAQGGGLGGVPQVRGRGPAGGSQSPSTEADVHGHFVVNVPSAGMWQVSASANGFRPQQFNQHGSFASAVVLSDSAPTYTVTLRLAADALLTGLVRDEAGEPVEHAQISAELVPEKTEGAVEAPATARMAGGATTDDRGRFEIASLAAGTYRVRVQGAPWYTQSNRLNGLVGGAALPQTVAPDPSLDLVYAPTWYPSATRAADAELVTLGPGDEREADVQLTAIPAVHVQVPVAPPATPQPGENGRGVRGQGNVLFTRVTDSGFDFVDQGIRQGDAGFVQSGGLAPGIYDVHVGGGGFGATPDANEDVREIEIPAGSSGVISLSDAVPLTHVTIRVEGVPENEVRGMYLLNTHTGRRIQASAPNSFRGGQRAGLRGGATRDEPAGDATSQPSHDHVALVPPGTYDVYLQNGAAYIVSVSAEGAKATGRTVEIGGGTPHLTIQAATGRAQVSGIVHAGDQALMGAMVVLVPATLGQPGDLDRTYRDESNTDGSFFLRGVIPGKYILIAIDHGWDVDWREPATLARYLEHGVPLDLTGGARVSENVVAQLP